MKDPSMQSTVVDVTKVRKELHVEVSTDELTPHFADAYRKYQQKATMPGFRPGKVPRAMIEKMYGVSIQYQEIEKIAQKFFQKAFDEKGLKPVARPVMTNIDFNPGQPLKFTVAYDVQPEIRLPDYKKLSVKQISADINDSDVENELDYIRKISGSFEHDAAKAFEAEDFATLEVEEVGADGKPSGHKLNPKFFSMRSEEFSEADKQKLIGKSKGDSVSLTMLDGTETGRPVQVTIQNVTALKKADLTDEFVKDYTKGQFQTVDAFRENLKEGIARRFARRSETSLQDSIMDELVGLAEMEVPETLVEAFLENFIHEVAHQQKDHKLPADFDENSYRDQNKPLAERSAKWYLIKQHLIEKENLAVTEDDFTAYLKKVSEQDKIPVESLRRAYSKPDARESVNNMILTDKLVALITSKVKVATVAPEDFKLRVQNA